MAIEERDLLWHGMLDPFYFFLFLFYNKKQNMIIADPLSPYPQKEKGDSFIVHLNNKKKKGICMAEYRVKNYHIKVIQKNRT